MRRLALGPVGIVGGIAALVAIAASSFFAGDASAQTAAVKIGSLTTSVGLEGTVELEALDLAPPGLGAWAIDVMYDPSVVEPVACGAEHGAICNASFGENTIRVNGAAALGLEGDILLAEISFACVGVGDSDLAISLPVFYDGTLGAPAPIDADVIHGSVQCLEEGTAPPPPSLPNLPGDANCDGEVDTLDAALVMQFAAGLIDTLPCSEDADKNGDGVVDVLDAALILQLAAGLL